MRHDHEFKGFDQIKGEYIRFPRDQWLEDHNIRKRGKQRGQDDLPQSDATVKDEIYEEIESAIEEHARDCRDSVQKYIDHYRDVLHDKEHHWKQENPEIRLTAIVENKVRSLRDTTEQHLSDLQNQRKEYLEADKDLEDFRATNGLSRVANYPYSRVSHWLWVPVAAMVEVFLSANLLGGVSRGGLVEGWLVATTLTVLNVLFGIGAGVLLRFVLTEYKRGFVKIPAATLCLIVMVAAAFWNIIAGHVRDVYVIAETSGNLESIDQAFTTAWQAITTQVLPWDSISSATLAMIGMAVFVLSVYKTFFADDPFPGYGSKHRFVALLREHYQDSLNEALAALSEVRQKTFDEIEEIKSRYELDQGVWDSTMDRLDSVVEGYPLNFRQYIKDMSYLKAVYRDANLLERSTPPPEFFNAESKIDEELLQPPEFTIPDRPTWGNIQAISEGAFEHLEDAYKELRERYTMLNDELEDQVGNS